MKYYLTLRRERYTTDMELRELKKVEDQVIMCKCKCVHILTDCREDIR